MYKIAHLLSLLTISLFILISCGRRGPVGPEGPPGPDGAELLPTSFEFNADLTAANDFEDYASVPEMIDIIPEDVMLAFLKEGETDEGDEVWRQLPLTEFTNRGTVIINFDFTVSDILVFMEANYTLQNSDGYQGLLIRAVHIPANYAAKMRPGALDDVRRDLII